MIKIEIMINVRGVGLLLTVCLSVAGVIKHKCKWSIVCVWVGGPGQLYPFVCLFKNKTNLTDLSVTLGSACIDINRLSFRFLHFRDRSLVWTTGFPFQTW